MVFIGVFRISQNILEFNDFRDFDGFGISDDPRCSLVLFNLAALPSIITRLENHPGANYI